MKAPCFLEANLGTIRSAKFPSYSHAHLLPAPKIRRVGDLCSLTCLSVIIFTNTTLKTTFLFPRLQKLIEDRSIGSVEKNYKPILSISYASNSLEWKKAEIESIGWCQSYLRGHVSIRGKAFKALANPEALPLSTDSGHWSRICPQRPEHGSDWWGDQSE